MNLPHLSRSPSLHRRLWGQDVKSKDSFVVESDEVALKYIMNPDGQFRSRWNIVAMLFILYTSIEVRHRSGRGWVERESRQSTNEGLGWDTP